MKRLIYAEDAMRRIEAETRFYLDSILELMRRLKGRLTPRRQSSQIEFLPNGYTWDMANGNALYVNQFMYSVKITSIARNAAQGW